MRRMICFVVVAVMLTACAKPLETPAPARSQPQPVESDHDTVGLENPGNQLTPYTGKWAGDVNDMGEWVLDINGNLPEPNVLLSVVYFGNYYVPVSWAVADNRLMVIVNDEDHRINIALSFPEGSDQVLTGTFEQYGETSALTLQKISSTPDNQEFYQTFTQTALERIEMLNAYSDYSDDGTSIPFSYTLYQRQENQEIIDAYGLDAIAAGHSDVDLMIALLNWVCDHFAHDGSSGMPRQRDMASVIEYAQKNGGVNCRGVSIILAEVCRIYGVEAKHITCMPKEANFDECHVVVHAYSKERGQWVMLDPTYRLILKNQDGEYMNLQMLRESYFDNTTLVPNENAGWNGTPFDIVNYHAYMAKNTFRFSCATDFYFGAEEGKAGNVKNMLVPVGYSEAKAKRTTTSTHAFWALPTE